MKVDLMMNKSKQHLIKVKNTIQSTSNKFLSSIMLESIILFLSGIQQIVLTSFLLFINFTEEQIAILISIVSLTQLSQVLSTAIYRKFRNKKKVIFVLRFTRSITLVCIPIVPIIFDASYYFLVILIFIFIRNSALNLIGGGFVEWNDSYIPEERKGIYYGTRNVLSNGVYIIISFIFGHILDNYTDNIYIYIGIFGVALFMNILQWIILKDIPYKLPEPKEELPLVKTIFSPLQDKHYRSFILFSILWTLSASLGRPLLNIYAIKYMHYSYFLIAGVASLSSFFKLFSGIYFGKVIDKKSSHYVIIVTGIGYALINFAYIFLSPSNYFIYILANVVNGIFMIGFNVSKFRLNMQLSKGDHMNAYLSMNVFFVGIAAFISIYFSSFFIKLLKTVDVNFLGYAINSYQILFLLSGIFHLFALFYFFKTLNKEAVHD